MLMLTSVVMLRLCLEKRLTTFQPLARGVQQLPDRRPCAARSGPLG